MSQQGLARTQQLLQVIGAQLPSIAQASETPGLELRGFIHGALHRSGIPFDNSIATVVLGLVQLIGPQEEASQPSPPLDDRIADT